MKLYIHLLKNETKMKVELKLKVQNLASDLNL